MITFPRCINEITRRMLGFLGKNEPAPPVSVPAVAKYLSLHGSHKIEFVEFDDDVSGVTNVGIRCRRCRSKIIARTNLILSLHSRQMFIDMTYTTLARVFSEQIHADCEEARKIQLINEVHDA